MATRQAQVVAGAQTSYSRLGDRFKDPQGD